MTQEDKDLLLRDLCARLPYNVIGLYSWKGHEPYNRELFGSLYDELECSWGKLGSLWDPEPDSKFLPYLRPLSSMTEEEEKQEFLDVVTWEDSNGNFHIDEEMPLTFSQEKMDWLLAHHFDFRGLIPKGLALSTDKFNPYV